MSAETNSLTQLAVVYSDSEEEKEESEMSPILQPVKEGAERAREHNVEDDSTERTRIKLEIPDDVLHMFKNSEVPTGLQSTTEHQGRVRSFDHFPGNWATHVLVPFTIPESFLELMASLESVWPKEASKFHVGDLDDLHVSISRTVPIRHHWIDPLIEFLQRGLDGKRRFIFDFPKIGVYVNDEKTRTFLALEVDLGVSQLKNLVAVVDRTFREFGLQEYYEKPSFHASFAWCLGDMKRLLQFSCLTKMQAILDSYVENTSPLVFTATEIQCQTGNKVFRFSLKGDD